MSDITLSTFLPVFSFLFVFVVSYAIIAKTKLLGENKFINIFISFLIAIIFLGFSSVREYVINIVPWFAVLITVLFFILLVIGFTGKLEDLVKPGFVWFFVVVLVVIFLVAAVNVFSTVLQPYLPGGTKAQFLYTEKFLVTFLLVVTTAIVSWVLTRS